MEIKGALQAAWLTVFSHLISGTIVDWHRLPILAIVRSSVNGFGDK